MYQFCQLLIQFYLLSILSVEKDFKARRNTVEMFLEIGDSDGKLKENEYDFIDSFFSILRQLGFYRRASDKA